jgi:hypothetical protein
MGRLDTIAVSSVYGLLAGEWLCEWRSRERRRRNTKGQCYERWRFVAPSPLNNVRTDLIRLITHSLRLVQPGPRPQRTEHRPPEQQQCPIRSWL